MTEDPQNITTEETTVIDSYSDCKDSESEIKVYQTLIDKMALLDSKEILPNAGKIHAAIVMSKLFEKTQNSVSMVVGSFDGNVSNQSNYYNQLSNCIEKRVKFDILLLDSPNENSKSYKLLIQKRDSGYPITLRKANEKVRAQFFKTGKWIHFSVFDKNKYRLEMDTENYKAWVCFNNLKDTQLLSNLFKDVFAQSQQL